MIKVFTTNKNGKIELTKDELKELLDEAYWEGYNNNNTYTYHSPSIVPTWKPYVWCGTGTDPYGYQTIMLTNSTSSSGKEVSL